jgi:hypothetical protein
VVAVIPAWKAVRATVLLVLTVPAVAVNAADVAP